MEERSPAEVRPREHLLDLFTNVFPLGFLYQVMAWPYPAPDDESEQDRNGLLGYFVILLTRVVKPKPCWIRVELQNRFMITISVFEEVSRFIEPASRFVARIRSNPSWNLLFKHRGPADSLVDVREELIRCRGKRVDRNRVGFGEI